MAVNLKPSDLPAGYRIEAVQSDSDLMLHLLHGRGSAQLSVESRLVRANQVNDDSVLQAVVDELVEHAVTRDRAAKKVDELNGR